MKAVVLSICLLCCVSLLAQPSKEDIKKHKIKKMLERRIDDGGTKESFWYYDRKGYDSLQNYFNDTVRVKNTFRAGKLAEKTIIKTDGKNDVFVYEYKPDGSYKETFTDGGFKMKSYKWYDKKGTIMKSQSPDGNTITYKYDAKGKLVTVTSDGKNQGIKINHKYTYNTKGQLIRSEENMDGNKTSTTYEYDAKGRLVKALSKGGWEGEDAETTTDYEYNEKGLEKKRTLKSKSSESTGSVTAYEYEYEYY